jgi:hypothetical protein
MKVITGRKIIVQDAQSNFTTPSLSNPFAKPSPFGNISLQGSAGLTNPFINKGTTAGGLTNPWAKAPTNYLQQSIDKKKEEEFKKSPEYAEMQKRIEETKKKIEQKAKDEDDEKLLSDDDEKLIKKVGKTGLIISGVLIVGTMFFVFALVKAIKK